MSQQDQSLVYESGHWQVHLGRRELRASGVPVAIGARAFEIVELLVRSANVLVTKDDLMDRIWPGATVGENTVQVHISAIRRALGRDRAMLKTVSGRGYRLLGTWTVGRHDASAPPIGLQHMRGIEANAATNFPAAVVRVIGRSDAMQRIRDLVSAYRVVTLAGPGGIGKTTLALKVGRRVLAEFGDGGWLVELASLSDPALVPSAVARALGLKLGGEAISAEAVASAIGGRHILLLLDNCEHVIDAAANLAEMLVRLCPRCAIVATSREALRIDSEYVYRVMPLEVPAVALQEAGDIRRHSAVELFLARTQALGTDFSTDTKSLAAIAAICRRLDGIPLAIAFAASRAAALGTEVVAATLRDRLTLLGSGQRNVAHRHRTLRATLDWSYNLLPEAEQLLFRRLAVFPAGFTSDAARAAVGDTGLSNPAIVEGIANLVEKSLVTLDAADVTGRWYLLETIRSYALEKLEEHGETEHAARCHARYFRDVFASAVAGFRLPIASEDLIRHGRELDNVRAALDWCFSSGGDTTIGIDLTVTYAPVWTHLSLMTECCERCERALRGAEAEPQSNVWALMWLRIALGSALLTILGPSERAHNVLVEALGIADKLDDVNAQARALAALVSVYTYRGEYHKARAAGEQLQRIAHRIGDPGIVLVADRVLGTTLLTAGMLHEAQECLERVLQLPVTPDDHRHSNWRHSEHRAMARAMLARALWLRGFSDKAKTEAFASLDELQGRDHHLSLCRVIYYGLGRITPMTGDFETAEQVIARLATVAATLKAPFWATAARFLEGKLLMERGAFTAGLAVLRDAFATCRRTGWSMSYPEFRGVFAAGLAGLGQLGEALEAVDDGITSAGQRESGQQWYVPELLRIKSEVLIRQDPERFALASQDCLDQAGEMARKQGALFWELRIALSLARLRMIQGRPVEAGRLLRPVYDRFTEGFEMPDLLAARVILESGRSITSR